MDEGFNRKVKLKSFYKISVIIPVYKTEKFLIKCLNSIFKYDTTDIEIIVVLDGYSLEARNIVKE